VNTDKVLEDRLRRTLARRGYTLIKSRARDPKALTYGRYLIAWGAVTADRAQCHIDGTAMTLSDVQRWVDEP